MLGFAQKLLMERGFQIPSNPQVSPWVLLEQCVSLKLLPYVDMALAQALLKGNSESSEGLAAFLCHLSFAARQGNLCISIESDRIEPDPRVLWLTDEEEGKESRLEEKMELLEKIYQLILREAENRNACGTGIVEGTKRYQTLYYLQKFWVLEEIFINSLRELIESPSKLQLNETYLQDEIKKRVENGLLLPSQAKGVESLCQYRLTVLTGGPGTGKTYTAGQMIRLIWESLDPSSKSNFEIVLAAPTGKAAANLQASLSKSIQGIEGFPSIQARTLHTLLGIKSAKTQIDLDKKLSADLILVDESSMIDVRLMASLFSAIKPGARLILLGDRHQLPPVEAGGLFADLIDVFEQVRYPALVALDQCMRAERAALIDFASAAKAGNVEEASRLLKEDSPEKTLAWHPLDEKTSQQRLIDYVKPYFHKSKEASPIELLREFNRFRILTPLRKGPFGVEAINALLSKSLFASVAPIMLMQNDYRLDLYNGESGILIRDPMGDYALFAPRIEGDSLRRFPVAVLPKYEYAYCVSVHKSQGSEFDHVLMLVPKGSECFGREVFYTAATRARKKLDVWGDFSVIEQTLAVRSRRLSGCGLKLRSEIEKFKGE